MALGASEPEPSPGWWAVARGARPWRLPLRDRDTVTHIMFSSLTLSEPEHLEDKKSLIL